MFRNINPGKTPSLLPENGQRPSGPLRKSALFALMLTGFFILNALFVLLLSTGGALGIPPRAPIVERIETAFVPLYEGGTGDPTQEEIALFKANINDALRNYPAKYPWGESYILMSLVEMYKATRDTFFLDKMVLHADAVIARRDDLMTPPLLDQVRGKVMPAWGSSSYGTRTVFLSHTGMIAYPIAAFARIVLEDPALRSKYEVKAKTYRTRIQETIDAFDNEGEWVDVGTTEGYYYCPQYNILGEGPLNGMTAIGRAIIELHLATGDAKYRTRAEKIANRFKSDLSYVPATQSYSWHYWRSHVAIEDISHGACDIDFACLAWRHGIVFTTADLERFAKTLVDVMVRPDGYHLSYYVDGTVSLAEESTQSASRWLDLAQVDPRVYDLIYQIQVVHGLRTSQQIDYAKLLKWKPAPTPVCLWAIY